MVFPVFVDLCEECLSSMSSRSGQNIMCVPTFSERCKRCLGSYVEIFSCLAEGG